MRTKILLVVLGIATVGSLLSAATERGYFEVRPEWSCLSKVRIEMKTSIDGSGEASLSAEIWLRWKLKETLHGVHVIACTCEKSIGTFTETHSDETASGHITLSWQWSPGKPMGILRDVTALKPLVRVMEPFEIKVKTSGETVVQTPDLFLDRTWGFLHIATAALIGVPFPMPEDADLASLSEGKVLLHMTEDKKDALKMETKLVVAEIDAESSQVTFELASSARVGPQARQLSLALPKYPDHDISMRVTWDYDKRRPVSFSGKITAGIYDSRLQRKLGSMMQKMEVHNVYQD